MPCLKTSIPKFYLIGNPINSQETCLSSPFDWVFKSLEKCFLNRVRQEFEYLDRETS